MPFVLHKKERQVKVMENMAKQNSFSRSMANDQKLGAYFTDSTVCEMIGRYLDFPDGHVNIMEPSVGDATALFSILKGAASTKGAKITKKATENIKMVEEKVKGVLDITTYAVEINKETYADLAEKNVIDYLVRTDFLTGMQITNRAFNFCFSNPPYGVDPVKKERYEVSFMKRISATMKPKGIFCYVIPEYVISEDKTFKKEWLSRFVTAGVYRFPENVYQQFKQCVIFGVRKNTIHIIDEEFKDYEEKVQHMQELDASYDGERLHVPSGEEKDVRYFTTYEQDPKKNIKALAKSPILGNINLCEKKFTNTKIGNPIVPLNDNLVYLLAVSGCGQGLAGSKENKDLHLQRGCVKRVTHSSYESDKTGKTKEVVTETSAVCMTIIENDGTITTFDS